MRKRLLDLGKRWQALFSDRTWIPRPREQLKSAFGAAFALREALGTTVTATRVLQSGRDYPEFMQLIDAMDLAVNRSVRERETFWAELLENITRYAPGEENA